MTVVTALASFSLAALLVTLAPGIDTALVLRTAAVENRQRALCAGLGIVTGVFAWGLIAACGLGALLAMSQTAYRVLQLAGAAYLVWLGMTLLLRSRAAAATPGASSPSAQPAAAGAARMRWFARGLTSNLLNPKVGAFYVGFLPQFIPADVDVVAFSALLAGVHALITLVWFALIIRLLQGVTQALQRPAVRRALDAVTGITLMGFGLRLALHSPPR